MPTDLFKHLFEAIKLTPKHLIAISLVLGFLLFAPAEQMQWLSVADVAKDYRKWFGIGLLICAALLCVSMAEVVCSVPRHWLGKWRFNRKIRQRLGRLTEDEKQILRFYIGKQTRSNVLRTDDGVVQGLAAVGIIYRSTNLGNVVEGFAHNIGQAAWDALNNDHSLLNGATNTYRTDKRDDSVW